MKVNELRGACINTDEFHKDNEQKKESCKRMYREWYRFCTAQWHTDDGEVWSHSRGWLTIQEQTGTSVESYYSCS